MSMFNYDTHHTPHYMIVESMHMHYKDNEVLAAVKKTVPTKPRVWLDF